MNLPALRCPECGVPLTEARVFGEARYGCLSCRGLAVPLAVLVRITEPSLHAVFTDALAHAATPSDRNCPRCPQRLARVELVVSGLVVAVDACRPCELVWFDAGELEQIPKRPRFQHEPMTRAEVEAAFLRRKLALRRELRKEADALLPTASPLAIVIAFLGFPIEAEAAPLADEPWATRLLCVLLVVAFILERTGALTIADLGFIPAQWTRALGLTAVTSFFLHADWGHLLGNVWFLYTFGDDVEVHLGRRRFLVLLVAGTVAGALVHGLGAPDSTLPLIGASTGISAILAFYGFQFPGRTLINAYLRIPVRIPALGFVALWVILQLIGATLQMKGLTAVSGLGHLGGAIAGLVAWGCWRQRSVPEL